MLILAITCQLNAQEEAQSDKGFFVGGRVAYSTGNSNLFVGSSGNIEARKATSILLSPYIGGKSGEHWVFGIGFGISYRSNISVQRLDPYTSNEIKSQYSSIAPYIFGRYSINPAQKLQFFLAPNAEFRFGTYDRTIKRTGTVLDSSSNYGWEARIGLGIQYRINQHLRLLSTFGAVYYEYNKTEDSESRKELSFYLNPSRMTLAAEWLF